MNKRTTIIAAVFTATALWAGMAHAIGGTNPLPRTGQGEGAKCYNTGTIPATEIACAGTKQDGETFKGLAWPGTRFTDTGFGTIIDNLTGLTWLKNARCFSNSTQANGVLAVAALKNGDCDSGQGDMLQDGSLAGSWRLPTIRELESLIDLRNSGTTTVLPSGHPFTNVPTSNACYWSSTPNPAGATFVYPVNFNTGSISTIGNYGDSEDCAPDPWASQNSILPVK